MPFKPDGLNVHSLEVADPFPCLQVSNRFTAASESGYMCERRYQQCTTVVDRVQQGQYGF